MKTKTLIRLTGFVLMMTAVCAVSSPAQVIKREKGREKTWFIARVVNTEPFMLEYVDDWYRHLPHNLRSDNYDATADTNPQSQTEDVSKFRLGDMIAGEFCNHIVLDCPSGVVGVSELNRPPGSDSSGGLRLPPNIAINLKRLGKKYKHKYRKQGFLLDYRPDPRNLIQNVTIYRDGTIKIGTNPYVGGLLRQLSDDDLMSLERAFFAGGTDKVESSKSEEWFKLGLTSIFGKYRSFAVDQASKKEIAFTSFLDDLLEKQMRTAIYRINYTWRFLIKDWKYGDILPLDEAVDRKYRFDHWETLSKLKVPSELWEEARERYGEVPRHYYRYKGGLYTIQFGTWTDGSTGTWAGYLAAGGGKPVEDGRIWGIFEEWPKDLQIKLPDIPPDAAMVNANGYSNGFGKGLEIPKSDVEKNSEFFKRFFYGGASYREGEYIYSGLLVWFH